MKKVEAIGTLFANIAWYAKEPIYDSHLFPYAKIVAAQQADPPKKQT